MRPIHHLIKKHNYILCFSRCCLSHKSNANIASLDSRRQGIKLKCYEDIEPMIGLEIHAQLSLNSKLFSQGGRSVQARPNSQLDLLDIALPGTLPKLNRNALRSAILTSLGLNCTIQGLIHFDRKNYFYTDMPAGYQVTQYNKPIARDGFIEFIVKTYHKSCIAHSQHYDLVRHLYADDQDELDEFKPYIKRSYIKQVQIEQDSAKTLNQVSQATMEEIYNLVDYNRCGSGLIEIVFEPDLNNHHEASSLVKELVFLLKTLDTCDCELQEGSLRVDANVSIKRIANQAVNQTSRVELKNLNSIRSLNRGILQEVMRQAELIKAGHCIKQESRTYDTKTGKTVPLRLKEDAVDYRYVPEPSIPPLVIDRETIDKIKKDIPSRMPVNIREELIKYYNLELDLISEIMDEPGLAAYMSGILRTSSRYNPAEVAKFLIYTISNLKDVKELTVQVNLDTNGDFVERLPPNLVGKVLDMVLQEDINYATAYELIKYILVNDIKSDPRKIVEDFGWYQINDDAKVDGLCSDGVIGMKNISKRYTKTGQKKYMRLMLDKLCELTDNKINIEKAIGSLNKLLNPPKRE